jgi:hypothetical protein
MNKTGIGHPKNSKGNGVRSRGKSSHSNCVVSVESAFGYNEVGNSSVTKKGGNADGFIVNHHAHNITFIDVHAHNNSDDGFDFWKGGLKNEKDPNEPTIRIFYSSANQNGKNPFTLNKDGMGFKFGSWDQYEKYSGKDEGMSEIYDGNSLQDDIVHEAKQRSFLRFGKRSENYLRFGKKADFDGSSHGKKSENYIRFGKRFWPHAIPVQAKKRNNEEEPNNTGQFDGISEIQSESLNKKNSGGEPHGCTSFGDGYFVICRVDYGNKRNNRYKKARDFLRFG